MWPLLLPVIVRTRYPVAWLLVAFLAVTSWRYYAAFTWRWDQAYFAFDTRMSGILLGAIAALTRFKVSTTAFVVACIALAIVIAIPSLPSVDQTRAVTLIITLAELSAFVIVCHAAQRGRTSTFLAAPPMVYIGKLSYGIFIWHFPVVLLLAPTQSQWITLSSALLFSLVMAAICLHLVDMPIKRWRERSWSSAQPAP
jgi:peptidoglycan/LPS O-acetylase OafA/YrhL